MNNKLLNIHLLTQNEEFLARFNFLLQNGFIINAVVGCTIYEFLSEQCHLTQEYIEQRISTVFLDGNPVDDMKKAILEQDSVLSLSGAMPGLIGAVMRTGSYYASFRDSITYKKTAAESEKFTGSFKLKLFNILMSEMGPFFLKRGFFLLPSDFVYFLRMQQQDFWQNCKEIFVDKKSVNNNFFEDTDLHRKFDNIFLKITII